jgi:hypothetical protein
VPKIVPDLAETITSVVMPNGSASNLKFEIGHVLFIDIVGYSKLPINQQTELLETLKKVVRDLG